MKTYNLDKYEGLLTKPQSIYLLGLLWSDGYFQKAGENKANYSVCLRLQSEDFYEIESLMTPDWGNWKVFDYKQPKNAKKTWKKMKQGTINSRELCLFLEKYDFHLKSKKGPIKLLEKIPENMRHYFLRGYSDGDGCFYIRKNKQFCFSISASYDFDWEFLNYFCFPFAIRRKKSARGNSSSVHLEKREFIIQFGEFIYQGELIGLKRKYNKFLQAKSDFEEKLKPKYLFEVISPNGEEYIIYNVVEFCRIHNLDQSALWNMLNGILISCKGWRLKTTSLEDFLNRRIKNAGAEHTVFFKGQKIKIKNVSKYCRDNNLSRGSFKSMLSGKMKKYKEYALLNES